VEIERISVQKQWDVLNKLKLVKAMQETSAPIRGFMQRLGMLAYAWNFNTRCPSWLCTAANTEVIILLAMVKGLANVDIQAELLAEVEQMSLEDTIALISIREADVVAAANARTQWLL
jgi:hypothetical protein